MQVRLDRERANQLRAGRRLEMLTVATNSDFGETMFNASELHVTLHGATGVFLRFPVAVTNLKTCG
jgi:hypothetical protein